MLNFLILQTYTGPILVAVNPYQELPYYNSVSILLLIRWVIFASFLMVLRNV